jgi:hypothetical protein
VDLTLTGRTPLAIVARRLARWIGQAFTKRSAERFRHLRGCDFDTRFLACTFFPFFASC